MCGDDRRPAGCGKIGLQAVREAFDSFESPRPRGKLQIMNLGSHRQKGVPAVETADPREPVQQVAARSGRSEYRPRATCAIRSEEPTSELQSIMRISYAVFCLNNNKKNIHSLLSRA